MTKIIIANTEKTNKEAKRAKCKLCEGKCFLNGKAVEADNLRIIDGECVKINEDKKSLKEKEIMPILCKDCFHGITRFFSQIMENRKEEYKNGTDNPDLSTGEVILPDIKKIKYAII